jgi:hypothetical protein
MANQGSSFECQVHAPPEEQPPRITVQLNVSVEAAPPVRRSRSFEESLDNAYSTINSQWHELKQELDGDQLLGGSITLQRAHETLGTRNMEGSWDVQKALDDLANDISHDPKIHVSLSFSQGAPASKEQRVKNDLLNQKASDHQGRSFINVERIRACLTPENIRDILKKNEDVDDGFVDEVRKNGVKLLASLILVNTPDVSIAFMQCWKNKTGRGQLMRDDCLPFEKGDMPCSMQPSDWDEFLEKQWQTCAFVFKTSTDLPKEFRSNEILPIIYKEPLPSGEGNFGLVSEIKIADSHQNLYRCIWVRLYPHPSFL